MRDENLSAERAYRISKPEFIWQLFQIPVYPLDYFPMTFALHCQRPDSTSSQIFVPAQY